METKRHFQTWVPASLCMILLAAAGPAFARTIYVDDDASGAQDGSSWAAAFPYLQSALAVAKAGDEIHMAQGVYRAAYLAPGAQVTASHIEASFHLVDGTTILGGFAGLGTADPDLRDPARFATVLNGDLGGNDDDLNNERRWYDNSKHILVAKNVGDGTVLDGLTITHGYAYGDHGAGLDNDGESLLVRDCTFCDNGAYGVAGVYNNHGKLRIERCRFIGNWSDDGAGALNNRRGSVQVIASEFIGNHSADGTGAVDNSASGDAVFFGCLFRGNVGTDGNGALWNTGELRLRYCTFIDNEGSAGVGAVICMDGHAVIANCLFVENTGAEAGAMSVLGGSASLDHCTFYGNVATDGFARAVYCGPAQLMLGAPAASLHACGCIFWANRALDADAGTDSVTGYEAQIGGDPNAMTVEYCCIEGWTPEHGGVGNLGADPLFVAPDQNDFHLKSQAGHWDATALAWVRDDVTSPCIDAGDPNSAVEQEPFPNGGRVNLGVYGGTSEASKSWFGAEPSATINAADLNGDGKVDAEDYRLALQRWPQTGQ